MIVCICHRVSDRDIAREVRSGCADFASLQDTLRVATGCGACREHAEATFLEHAGAAACAGCPGAVHRGAVPLGAAA
ncbi:(2Fe-2S)-binding protein [Rubrivivax sp. RP6-9]|uniref:(2Fe-2S)-binding protein n=1 Tax=Rubrivivax sp. RP6-9 TaxID=3415750 RepID=UPI003CC66F92